MKFSQVVYAHNIYRWTYKQLFNTGRRRVFETNLYQQMINSDVKLHEATDVVKEFVGYGGKILPVRGMRVKPPALDQRHPDWHDQPCLTYKDDHVLPLGLEQAKYLTNSVELEQGLPGQLTSIQDDSVLEAENELIQTALASAVVYDAEQKKLPIRKDPERPAWNFPRDLGISDVRKNFLLCHRFLHMCELLAGFEKSRTRCKLEDAFFSVPLLRNEDIIQLQLTSDLLLLSEEPLKQIRDPQVTVGTELPDFTPMKYTIGIREENLYQLEDIFPLTTNKNRVHTAFIHFNGTEVQNLYKTPVQETQTVGRSLMKAFAVAAAQARFLYGKDVERLPEPIVVQCIQTDAKYFHFSVFQLNTLSWPPSNTDVRNIFWSDSIRPIYDFGGYFEGKPTITSYDPEIFKTLFAFYNNI